ncbi:WD40 repeat domain-containing protein [archaeon]|nr:MAG: WD40 repeat domain-containing protein [archaeon]
MEVENCPYVSRSVQGVGVRPVLSVANYISLDIECIVAGSSDRTIRFLDTDSLQELAKCTVDKKSVNFVAVSEMSPEGDDPVIATGGKDSVVQIWDPTSGSVDQSITLPTTEIRSLAIFQGVSLLILMVGTKDGNVFIWDVKENKQLAKCEGHKASVHCVCIASTVSSVDDIERDLSHLCFASGGADRTVRTWDVATGKKIKKFRHVRSISSMVVTNRGVRPLLATAGVERMIKLWDLNSGVLLRCLTGHLDQINTLCLWEGLQMLLISGSSDLTLRVYDMLSGECICVLQGHTDSVLSVAVTNANDPKIVSSSEDLSLIQWDFSQILRDYYYTDGDLAGARNDREPLLPEINYKAPEELDKDNLSKDERKRIRKERKKEKRRHNLSVNLRASLDVMNSDSSMPSENQEMLQAMRDAQDAAKDGDQIRDAIAVEPGGTNTPPRKVSMSSNLIQQVIQKTSKVLPDRPGSSGSQGSMKSVGSKSSLGVVTNWVKKAIGVNNAVEPLDIPPISNNQADGNSEPTAETKEATPVPETPKTLSSEVNSTSAARKSSILNEDEFKAKARTAQSNFQIAVIEQQLETDRQKSKAADKLQQRLMLRNKLMKKDEDGSVAEPVSEENKTEEEKKHDAELHQLKAEKLKQHKLQEHRRKASMMVAQQRSAEALQKRLEDLAAKKKQQATKLDGDGGGSNENGNSGCNQRDDLMEIAEEGESDDDDDDNDES